jgi:2-amino-4-hydroxy-6-hydroxymethyldihydropteridine diphosphokinase
MTVTIALGANLGDRHATLATARQLISERIGTITAQSSLLETKAWGVENQADFLNQVIVIKTHLGAATGDALSLSNGTSTPFSRTVKKKTLKASLEALLDQTQAIETELGRQRKNHWGPRTCDLDLIFVDDIRIETARLSLPHPWWAERDFVEKLIRQELTAYSLQLFPSHILQSKL